MVCTAVDRVVFRREHRCHLIMHAARRFNEKDGGTPRPLCGSKCSTWGGMEGRCVVGRCTFVLFFPYLGLTIVTGYDSP